MLTNYLLLAVTNDNATVFEEASKAFSKINAMNFSKYEL